MAVAAWCCHPCPMLGPSWLCGGGAGGLGSAKAIQSGGSHPCVVNELADAVAAWRAGTVGF